MAGSDRRAAALVRWRWPVVAGWILLVGGLAPLALTIEERLTAAARVNGSESAALEPVLATRFGSPFARWAMLVLTGIPGPDTPEGRVALERVVGTIDGAPSVTRTFSYLDDSDSLFVGAHGAGTFVVAGLDPAVDRPERMLPELRQTSARLEAVLRAHYPKATARWTGEVALNADLREASAAAAATAERRALPLTLAVLLLAFGALAAAVLPLIAAGVAVGVTFGIVAVAAAWWPLSIVLQNVVSMLGIGLGIDYALLTVSRFRASRADGRPVHDAATECVARAGPTVLLSAGTVAIGFGALLLIPLDEVRAIAVGGLLVTLISALVAVTLVPALLAIAGSRLELGHLHRRHARADGWWRAWARLAVSRPRVVLTIGALPVCALAWQATRLDTRLPRGDWLPRDMESARAVRDLQMMNRGNVVQGIRVVLDLPPGMPVLDHAGWRAMSRMTAALLREPEVARVRSLPTIVPGAVPGRLLESLLPADVSATFVSRDGRATMLEVIPTENASPNALVDLVVRMRERGAAELSGVPGAGMLVGGIPAFNADYRGALSGRFIMLASVVIGASLLVLGVALRSILIPLKAVALNLLSVAAAFGAMVLVFGDGAGIHLLGHDAPPGGTFPMIPVLVFCIVFGLSMDYELFLVSRVAEARRAGASNSDAIVEGVARTGRVITSAAAIMLVVFGAFMLGDVLLVQMLGFALAVAVLIDATVVRMAIGPALLRLAGRWNWWPGESPPRHLLARPGELRLTS
ncbi:MAG TPA: MMPL family transporter [Gemmatimonadaceae bacterium]